MCSWVKCSIPNTRSVRLFIVSIDTNDGRTNDRKTNGRTDIRPKDRWPKQHMTKDVWPNGSMAERHVTERTYRWNYKWSKNMEERTFARNDIWPKIHRAEEKINYKPNIPYKIWLSNRIPNETKSKIGTWCVALESYKKITYNKAIYLFSNYIT